MNTTLYFTRCRLPTISKLLEDEGIFVSRKGVANFNVRYFATGSTARRPGSGRRAKIMEDVKRIVDEQMKVDNETTGTQLHVLLVDLGYSLWT